jgi:ferritin
LALKLLDAVGPCLRVKDFRSFVFLKDFLGEVGQSVEKREGLLALLGVVGDAINEENSMACIVAKIPWGP